MIIFSMYNIIYDIYKVIINLNKCITYAQVSLVTLPPVTILFGDVKLLLAFTVTNDKSIPKVCAAT